MAWDLPLSLQARTSRGKPIMNTVEKFATAAVALTITLIGAILVIAPVVLAGPPPMM